MLIFVGLVLILSKRQIETDKDNPQYSKMETNERIQKNSKYKHN